MNLSPSIARILVARLVLPVLSLGLLTACSFTLAEDITPPPGLQLPPPQQATQPAPTTAAEPAFPAVPPDPAAGVGLFAEKCAPCHGERGLGDGPQAAQLPNPPAALGSPEEARAAVPAEWFSLVTQGNLDRFMPPFAGSLSEAQRWDVVAYALSLSTSSEMLAQGQALFEANCAACHGEAGKGDGPQAASLSQPPPKLTDQARMAVLSAADLYQAITAGVAPEMPAYGDQLGEADRWALAAYLRELTFQPQGTPPAEVVAAAPPESADGEMGSVTGRITNGSGGDLQPNLTVTLHGYDNMQAVYTTTAGVEDDGRFTINDVEMPEGRVFLVTVDYAQATYGSDVGIVEADTLTLDLPITVYETTTDTSSLFVERLHLFLDFLGTEMVQVTELYLISNPLDKVVVANRDGEPVVTFTLPVGATNLQFQDGALGDRYVKTADGFGDTLGVRPGSGQYQVLFAYNLPYERKLELNQTLKLPVNAVILLMPENGVRLRSDALQSSGVRDFQGETFEVFSGESLAAGSQLSLSLSGRPKGSGADLVEGNSTGNLAVGIGAFGLALVVAGGWLYRRSRAAGQAEETELQAEVFTDPNSLMDAIIALDDLYRAGELPAGAYQHRRAELKAQLSELLHD